MRVIINVFLVLLIGTSSLFSQKTSTKQNSDGYIKNFYNNEKLESEGIMKEDFEDGLWKYYYKNGNLKFEGILVGNSSDSGDTYEVSEGKSYKKNGKYKEIGYVNFSLD